MKSRIDRYRAYASVCAATTYGAGASIRRHNTAARRMRKLVVEPGAAEELLPLLDEAQPAEWLAFQLLELCKPAPKVRKRCLAIIRPLHLTGAAIRFRATQCFTRGPGR